MVPPRPGGCPVVPPRPGSSAVRPKHRLPLVCMLYTPRSAASAQKHLLPSVCMLYTPRSAASAQRRPRRGHPPQRCFGPEASPTLGLYAIHAPQRCFGPEAAPARAATAALLRPRSIAYRRWVCYTIAPQRCFGPEASPTLGLYAIHAPLRCFGPEAAPARAATAALLRPRSIVYPRSVCYTRPAALLRPRGGPGAGTHRSAASAQKRLKTTGWADGMPVMRCRDSTSCIS